MSSVQVKDKIFEPYISKEGIAAKVAELATQINADYKQEKPLFLVVLNGSFMFAADLLRLITVSCEISFIKLASYEGMESSGVVKTLLGLQTSLKGRKVLIVEDIVDTGNTLVEIVKLVQAQSPSSMEVVSLLLKPEAYKKDIPVKYVGIRIPNDFVVGYGLDYDGEGRNLPEIMVLSKNVLKS